MEFRVDGCIAARKHGVANEGGMEVGRYVVKAREKWDWGTLAAAGMLSHVKDDVGVDMEYGY